MKRVCVMKSDWYDWLNQIFWSEDFLREATEIIGNGYIFDETDKCVYLCE